MCGEVAPITRYTMHRIIRRYTYLPPPGNFHFTRFRVRKKKLQVNPSHTSKARRIERCAKRAQSGLGGVQRGGKEQRMDTRQYFTNGRTRK